MKKKFKITFNSPVVLSLVFASLVVTLLGEITNEKITQTLFMTYHSSLKNPMTYLRFFTHVLGHSGMSHFIGNVAYLLLLGPMLEEKYGSHTLVEIICLTALVTGLANYILFMNVALCGASGIVFAFILLASFTGFKDGELPLTFVLIALIYIGQQIFAGVFVADNVSNLSHIIGGLIGAGIGYGLNKKSRFNH